MISLGRDLTQFVNDFTWYLRNLLLLQSSDNMEDVLDISSDNLVALREEAGMVSSEVLMRYIRIFSDLGSDLRFSTQKRILIEIALIRLCRPEMQTDHSSMLDRLEKLERRMEQGIVVAAAGGAPAQQSTEVPVAAEQKPEIPKAIPEDIEQVIRNWKPILSAVGGVTKQYLSKAVPTLGASGELTLMLDDVIAFEYLSDNKAGCIDELKAVIAERIDKEIEIVVRKNESGRVAKEAVPDLREIINFEIVEED